MRTPPTPGLNHWIITRDFIADNESVTKGTGHNQHAPGVMSRHALMPDVVMNELQAFADQHDPVRLAEHIKHWANDVGMTQLFQLLDDDGNLYYEGYMTPFDQITSDDADGFEPLDDFGAPNAGATELRYWKQGEGWKTL